MSPRLLALSLSLGIHACVFAALVLSRESPKPKATPRFELTKVTWLEAETPSGPVGGGSTGAPTPRHATTSTKKQPVGTPTLPTIDDVPLRETKRGLAFLPPSLFEPAPMIQRGVTLTPEMMPGADELLAEEHERVGVRLDGFLKQGLAIARATSGLPDPAYGLLGEQLRAATQVVPKLVDTDKPKEVLGALGESWLAGAERYGKTGAPYAEPEGRIDSIERPSMMVDGVARGSPDAQAMSQLLSAGARLQEFADGRAGVELYALVEIRQQSTGAIDSIAMTRPSGLPGFDRWVLERAHHVGGAFTFDGGAKALRSVWRFDGILTFRRKMKVKDIDGRAAVGMAAMAALSALSSIGNSVDVGTQQGRPGSFRDLGPRMPTMSGRFDVQTGEFDLVDLTNPTYRCKVTLVEAD